MQAVIKKRILLFFVIIVGIMPFLSGCGGERNSTAADMVKSQAQGKVVLQNYDSANKQVERAYLSKPQRVIAFGESAAETLIQLGQGQRIIAVVDAVEDGAELKTLYPDFNKDGHCQFLNRPGVELLLSLQPDFMVGWYQNFTPKRYGVTDFWEEHGAKPYIPASSMPIYKEKTAEMELQYISDMGKLFDCKEITDQFIAEQKDKISKTSEKLAGKRPRVMVVALSRNLIINYGKGSLPGNIVELAGGEIVAEGRYLGVEDVLQAKPDVVFVVRLDRNLAEGAKLFMESNRFRSLECVHKKRVYGVPVHWMYNSGINIGKAINFVAEKLKL